ncbi:Flp pilus assembly protein TadD, contains TPR repeats [Shimia gijangensis]|uniref:Flp pilus assembly protein TadD, contains TPR repeats n=1 Tax=Shimia gijangensis TaxID=1470563 RepID=A0A1M6PEN8_9RHOB|nr:tetratricopeptide repeat-containing sulfotransferase family protein [Shimia gijangensis]SHK06419.1 Flp pilus assembly protein TadD, contains TPR repeats [Shimia gijangensis]
MANPAQIQMQKITAQMRAGQFTGAAKTATAAFKKFPREIGFANAAGSAHAQAGNFPQAVSFFNKALALAPGDAGTQDNLLRVLVQAGRAEKALELVDRLLKKRDETVPLMILKANAEMALERFHDAIATTSQALESETKISEIWALRGAAHDCVREDDAAIADFQQAFDLAPSDPTPLVNMAEPLTRRHRTDDALAVLQQALQIRPSDLRARRFLAIQLAQAGQGEAAKAEYHRLIEADPLDAQSFRALVLAQTAEENTKLKPALEAALKQLPQKSEGQASLNFAMGNLLFQHKDYEGAASALARANSLTAKTRPFNKKVAEAEFETLTRKLTSTNDRDPEVKSMPRPIFIIGQPRSGTTLCEMVLSAHPQVASCGEMEAASRVLDPALSKGAFDPVTLAAAFQDDLPEAALKVQAFVDKMPANYRYVDALLKTFPDAVFVHLTRDPRDVALSMWRNFFPNPWMNFTFDQRAMAYQANLYRRYMTHWQDLYPDRILTLDYKDIVSDIEGASREMAKFCGLDWIAEMAAPEKNTAMVRTASVTQVRQGVHQKSLGGWRRFEKALAPFCDALDPALWPDLD